MKTIPSGNVTFLFTDIEGSTKLAQKLPEKYHASLKQHDALLKEAIESNNGYIFKTVGDAFCASFSNSNNAVKAAIVIQKKLIEEFKDGIELKVRMGIHTGEADFANGDYTGYVTLSRTQRIMSIAHGGQMLVTGGVYEKAKDFFTFRDFGERKLKDIILPEHIYQIISENLPADFPPLRSMDARQNNLPTSITNFIGRKKELEEIKTLFSNTRLLSLTGAGGTGKTRLAVRLASELLDEFENGVWIIELSSITDPDFVVKEISTVLKLKEDPSHNILETLKEFLKDKNILLLFDNSEHLLTKCAATTETLLTNCPYLKIISTSRAPFNIHGETIYRVPPMSIPDKIKNETVESLSGMNRLSFFLTERLRLNQILN